MKMIITKPQKHTSNKMDSKTSAIYQNGLHRVKYYPGKNTRPIQKIFKNHQNHLGKNVSSITRSPKINNTETEHAEKVPTNNRRVCTQDVRLDDPSTYICFKHYVYSKDECDCCTPIEPLPSSNVVSTVPSVGEQLFGQQTFPGFWNLYNGSHQ